MPETFEIKTEGFAELRLRLNAMKEDMRGTTAYAATAAGARVVRDRAKRNAIALGLVDTGSMVENIAISRVKSDGFTFIYKIGVRGKKKAKKGGSNPWYWFMHEFGTSRMPARPFVTPALSSETSKALAAMARTLKRRIDKAESAAA